MGENLLVSVTADVMLYEDQAKQWVRPGENGSYATITNCGTPDMQKLSNVQILQGNSRTTFRIVAIRIHDGQILIDQLIFQKLKYQAATKCFHQWRNERRQVFGLSFSTEQEAEKFLSVVQRIMECVSSTNDTHYSATNGNGTNGFQEGNYQQVQQTHYKEPDQDSIGSGNGIHNNMIAPSYRKSSYSANMVYGVSAMSSSSNNSIHAQVPQQQHGHYPQQQNTVANGIQRRASQGSNNSSSTNSSGVMNSNNNNGAGIYAQANTNNGRGPMLSSANIQLNQAHVDALNTVAPSALSSVPPATSSSIPPISSNAPPPPPPPPSLNVVSSKSTLADQLKQTQLRKVSSSATSSSAPSVGVNRTSSTGGESTGPNKGSSVNSGGHSDLLSELAATINKRKNNAESNSNGGGNNVFSSHQTEMHEKRINGCDPAPRPWQKPALNPTVTSATTSSDSPRVNRKVPSGSSLSSQEEAGSTTNKEVNTNGVSASNSTATTITNADLDRFKQELILEFQREIIKMKQEIVGELAQLLQKQ